MNSSSPVFPPTARRSTLSPLVHDDPVLGHWVDGDLAPLSDMAEFRRRLCDLRQPAYLVQQADELLIANMGEARFGSSETNDLPVIGFAPRLSPTQLGDNSFCADHGIRFPYMTGAMANGIASAELVEAISKAGMLGSFGAAGLSVERVEAALDRLSTRLGETPYAINLIHSPGEPQHEAAVVDLFLRRDVRLIEASAYLRLTLPAVRYRLHGIYRDEAGRVITPNRIIAKASRVEVATRWLSPPPEKMVAELVRSGELTAAQAEMARSIPMAQDLTAEADSGGHTDNRPALTMLPTMIALRDSLASQYEYAMPIRIGAAGGIATPASAAAAFAMGAAYIVTGSINQACKESGSCDRVRKMLAETQQADVIMAPAADMFEMGVKLQVLKRGTMFAMRAAKLYELYRTYDSLDQIPTVERESIEKTIFKTTFEDVWKTTREFFSRREPKQVERAEQDEKHRMALVFRWYLGLSSRWANVGDPDRQIDYQIWCGPAMGAFNGWTRGSSLELPENRDVVTVARNVLLGAAMTTRLNMLRSQGIRLPQQLTEVVPFSADEIEQAYH